MLQEDEVKSWVLTVTAEVIAELGGEVQLPVHVDCYDDASTGRASPGRIASAELDAKGKLTWWNWRSADACARADWPLKAVLDFGEEHRTVWIHERAWNFDKASARPRVVRL